MATFSSPELAGLDFRLPRQAIVSLVRFLARASGLVCLRTSGHLMFATGERGDTFCWGSAAAARLSTSDYSDDRDEIVLRVGREPLMTALDIVRTITGGVGSVTLETSSERIVLGAAYDVPRSERTWIERTIPVVLSCRFRSAVPNRFLVALSDLEKLLDESRGHEVELRIAVLAGPPPSALVRTREVVVARRPSQSDPEPLTGIVTRYVMATPCLDTTLNAVVETDREIGSGDATR